MSEENNLTAAGLLTETCCSAPSVSTGAAFHPPRSLLSLRLHGPLSPHVPLDDSQGGSRERAQRRGCRKTSVFLSRETGVSGNFVGRIQGAKCPFDLQFSFF